VRVVTDRAGPRADRQRRPSNQRQRKAHPATSEKPEVRKEFGDGLGDRGGGLKRFRCLFRVCLLGRVERVLQLIPPAAQAAEGSKHGTELGGWFLRSRSDRQRWGAGPAGRARPRTPAGQRHRTERRCYPVPIPRGRAPLPSYGAPVRARSLRPPGPP